MCVIGLTQWTPQNVTDSRLVDSTVVTAVHSNNMAHCRLVDSTVVTAVYSNNMAHCHYCNVVMTQASFTMCTIIDLETEGHGTRS